MVESQITVYFGLHFEDRFEQQLAKIFFSVCFWLFRNLLMLGNMCTTRLPLGSVIESSPGCWWTLSLRRRARSTTFRMESSALVCMVLVSRFRKSDQKSPIHGLLPGRVQELLLLPHPGLEGVPAFPGAPAHQHHPERPQHGQNRAYRNQVILWLSTVTSQ